MDFSKDTPIFLQIAELLEDAILSGAYAEETQVPSITEFSVACKINPATALKGVNVLVDAGYLYKKRGVGMFVAAGAQQKILAGRKQRFYTDYVVRTAGEAKRLEVALAELLDMTKRGYEENGN